MLIDKAEIKHRFQKSMESYDENAYAQKAIICYLTGLLNTYAPLESGRILEAGCGTGLLTRELTRIYKGCELYINDLVEAMCFKAAGLCHLSPEHCIAGDIEQVEIKGRFDLIVSASTFQWLAYPAETFSRLAESLHPAGRLVFSTFGKDNYKELKLLTGYGLTYYSVDETMNLLAPFFDVIHAEESHCVLEFETPLEILHHIKQTGVNAVNSRHPWTRGKLEKFTREYADCFRTGTTYPLTYHPQYFVCRKK